MDTGDEWPADAGETAQRSRRSRVTASIRLVARIAVALLSVVALGVTGYSYNTLDRLRDSVRTTDALRVADEPRDDGRSRPPPPPPDDGATDILLVGTDSRTDMAGNPLPYEVLKRLRTENKPGVSTDTLIVLRIPKNGDSPTGISIPRDAWVDVPHGGKAKINSAYGAAKRRALDRLRDAGMTDRAALERESDQAGRRALVETVQEFTRIRVDHYAEVNLLGFYLLTEALGGVEVCLNRATSDPDSGANFRAGRQTVSGGEALSFVRQRKNLPRGDLDRIVRQQAFLASALNKVLSAGTLTDPDRLAKLADTVRRSLVLDSDMDLLQFAERVRGIASGDISFVTIPVTDIAAWSPDGRQSIVTVDVRRVREFVDSTVDGDEPRGDEPARSGATGSATAEPTGGGGAAGAHAATPAPRQITADGVTCVN